MDGDDDGRPSRDFTVSRAAPPGSTLQIPRASGTKGPCASPAPESGVANCDTARRSASATEQHVVLETDPARARAVAREGIAMYLQLPPPRTYVNNWARVGFGESHPNLTIDGT